MILGQQFDRLVGRPTFDDSAKVERPRDESHIVSLDGNTFAEQRNVRSGRGARRRLLRTPCRSRRIAALVAPSG